MNILENLRCNARAMRLLAVCAVTAIAVSGVAPSPVTAAAPPSGEDMPVGDLPGWKQIFTDDFTTDVPLGSFPAAVSSKWGAYPSPWKDTSGNGTYSPAVVSIGGGIMNSDIHTADGVSMVTALKPKLPSSMVYGRYAVRFRFDSMPGYKMAWMLWPDSNNNKLDGELDFPEMNLDSSTAWAFAHRTNSTGPNDQAWFKAPLAPGGWHTAVIEWSPNLVIYRYDGVEIGRTSERTPSTPMHWVLQTETALTPTAPNPAVRGNMQVDWVSAWAYDPSTAAAAAGAALPVVPVVSKERILDTRRYPLQVGYAGGKPAAGDTVSVQVAGRGGVPTTGVAAVTMNVIMTESSRSGFVTAWPSGKARPTASNLNVEGVGSTVSTLITVPMGADGKVNLFTQSGGHLVADVAGWLPTGTFVASTPSRLLDTRAGPGQLHYSGDQPGAGAVIDLQVGGVGPVPIKGVSAVVLSLTATEAAGPGFVTMWPTGTPRPLASALNAATAGATVSNQVTVPLGAGGKVSIFTQSGAHIVADVAGYYVAGGGFNALTPTRVLDTRGGGEQLAYSGGKPAPGQTVSLPVLGRAGVPDTGVGFVILNLTATEATAPGFVSAWPGGTPQPSTSVINLSDAGQTRANAVFAPVGADGTIKLYSQSGTDLVVDVAGWLPG